MTTEATGNGNAPGPLLLTGREAVVLLRIRRNTCYELLAQGRLPHVRLGRRILIGRPRLESRIARQQNLPEPPAPIRISHLRASEG
jgi:excisionase family DNA binding protein